MIFNILKHIVIAMVGVIILTSCNKVTVVIDEIPSNTPLGDPIYIVGNFNNWNPGHEKYRMKLERDSSYSIILPAGYGEMKYKFTRGNWGTVEKDICGEEIDDRSVFVDKDMTIRGSIGSWVDQDPLDCDKRTVIIEMLPGNTPEDDVIAIASELNSWDPDTDAIAQKNEKGEYSITIERPNDLEEMEFKVTRGVLSTSESDVLGRELPNRVLEFGKKDTMRISVEGWLDLPRNEPEQVTLVLNSIPKITPKDEPVYFASKLNSWKSGDSDYQFSIDEEGKYYLNLPRKRQRVDYKITRQGWHTVEVDKRGHDIENRNISLEKSDTVFIDVLRWKDQDLMSGEQITIILENIPENTPQGDDIFISGNFNNWDPGRLRYRFKKQENGKYYVKIPRLKGDLEFKLTRGNWDQEAIHRNSYDLSPLRYKYRKIDSAIVIPDILGWKDIPMNPDVKNITLLIDQLPDRTPNDADIYFASNLNGWDPENIEFLFEKNKNGKYFITIDRKKEGSFQYKITRGGWGRVEVDKSGNDIENRLQYFGFADTVYIEIVGWKDM